MMKIDSGLKPSSLLPKIRRLWELSAAKIRSIESTWAPSKGSPVFTIRGRYASRGWTEWTQGFQFGSAILQYDATGEDEFLTLGRTCTLQLMSPHLTHTGVHDHGFNNVSTYGNLWRLMREGRLPTDPWERSFYELALKVSGAVQAGRWTKLRDGGFIHSFNGPHSLFADTIRSLRSLALAHRLGQLLLEEGDRPVSLLERLVQHARLTAEHSVHYGEGRDAYDIRGRVAHETVFNVKDGSHRCPATQQGWSPFSTWTRGLAWVMLGFAEQLEYLSTVPGRELGPLGGRAAIEAMMLKAARATCDFYIANSPTDGIPYWDTEAPGLAMLKRPLDRPADPFNDQEPVDSSAAAIAAQGLLRLGAVTRERRYVQAGLTILKTLFDEPYLSTRPRHQGLVLHSVYHRPRGWDFVPPGSIIPRGESSQWGDYHAREAALYVQRIAGGGLYHDFFGP